MTPRIPARLTAMPTITMASRPRLPAASVRLETEINHPANVMTIPTNTMCASFSNAFVPSSTFLVFPRLALQEQGDRRRQADGEQEQIQHAAPGEHRAGQERERDEKQQNGQTLRGIRSHLRTP